jgi:phospholipase/lecithinase/hemolysin
LVSKKNIKIYIMQELYGLGARRIGVLGMPNIGCVPSQRTIDGGMNRGCSESENQAARLFNSKLVSQLDTFQIKFPEAKFVYLDIYNPLMNMVQNPAKYGNLNLTQALSFTQFE